MSSWMELEQRYYVRAARRQPIVLVRGQGAQVWDEQGRRYLDFTAGWGVNNVGHCNPAVVQAVAQQELQLLIKNSHRR